MKITSSKPSAPRQLLRTDTSSKLIAQPACADMALHKDAHENLWLLALLDQAKKDLVQQRPEIVEDKLTVPPNSHIRAYLDASFPNNGPRDLGQA